MGKCYSYIRFSSEKQRLGDSLRRQMKLSEDYAKNNGITLDTSLKMQDLGLSAYKQDHVTKGALGDFLRLVQAGKINDGSILLVESLDRLSRAGILDALEQFLSIIRAGITIVTLQDNMEYSRDSLSENFGPLLISITIMSRAHEESRTKAKRIAASWERKRETANDKILTSKCPQWLKRSEDGKEFLSIPERAEIIKQIYTEYLNGLGPIAICRMLNRNGVEVWGRSKSGWHKSYILKILKARMVLGEYQPMRFNKLRKRVNACDPIIGYYPAVISEQLFYKVQERKKRNTRKFGKTGKVSSLFGHVAKCGDCGSTMTYINKGAQTTRSLVCDHARRGGDCKYLTIPYKEFEESFFMICSKLNLAEIVSDNIAQQEEKVAALKGRLTTVKAKVKEAENRIDNLLDMVSNAPDLQELTIPKIQTEKISVEQLQTEKKELKKEIKRLDGLHDRVKNSLSELRDSMKKISGVDTRTVDLRKKVKSEIEELVQKIVIFPRTLPEKQLMRYFRTGRNTDEFKGSFKHIDRKTPHYPVQAYQIHFHDGGIVYVEQCLKTETFGKVIDVPADIVKMQDDPEIIKLKEYRQSLQLLKK